MEDRQNASIVRDDPGMEKRVPCHGIPFAKTTIKRVRVGKNIGIEQLTEARRPAGY
jgi:hypothetical protein